MPKRELIVRREDILERILRIEDIVGEIGSAEAFFDAPIYRDALERNFGIIGEAVYQIRKQNPELALTEKDKIIALRHIIVHDYYAVDPKQLWVLATGHLALLRKEISLLIDDEKQKLFGTSNPDLDI